MKKRPRILYDARKQFADYYPIFIYAYVSPSDVVVYVGRTYDPGTRHGAHRKNSSWWTSDLAFSVIRECRGWECAKRCEARAIRDLAPVANQQHNRAVA